jgi:hypothetical protein
MRFTALLTSCVVCVTALSQIGQAKEPQQLRLSLWERGVAFQSPADPKMKVYLWFYEWNMFEARSAGEHTRGAVQEQRSINKSMTRVELGPKDLRLTVDSGVDYADLSLTVANRTSRTWPKIAAIIPCFNPGPPKHRKPGAYADEQNQQFANTQTYFHGPDGLERLMGREIHFNDRLRKAVDLQAENGRYSFSSKWPTAKANAQSGVIVRESTNKKWVTAIAWRDFLSAQGHNPWECMHLSVQVGPLKPAEEKTVKGRIYLFQGLKEDCFQRYRDDFKVAGVREP